VRNVENFTARNYRAEVQKMTCSCVYAELRKNATKRTYSYKAIPFNTTYACFATRTPRVFVTLVQPPPRTSSNHHQGLTESGLQFFEGSFSVEGGIRAQFHSWQEDFMSCLSVHTSSCFNSYSNIVDLVWRPTLNTAWSTWYVLVQY
jgi:hypothetical protein